MTTMLTRASQAVEDALASDDNHPDDIARAVLMAVREPHQVVTSAMDAESYPDSGSYTRWQAGIDAILAGDA